MNTVPISHKIIAFGSKKIYLPKFTIALVRNPHDTSPFHARFLVPLNFSKYDLRDYLYHAYNVRSFNIRSFVRQMPLRDVNSNRQWFRPPSKKFMTIEMEQPFVWPTEPENYVPWGRDEYKRNMRMMQRGNEEGHVEGRKKMASLLKFQAGMLSMHRWEERRPKSLVLREWESKTAEKEAEKREEGEAEEGRSEVKLKNGKKIVA